MMKKNLRLLIRWSALASATLFLFTSCAGSLDEGASTTGDDRPLAQAQDETEETEPAADYAGSVQLEPSHGPAGTEVTFLGTGLPEAQNFDIKWSTAECSWDVQGEAEEEYHGRLCTEKEVLLAEAETDAGGGLEMSFEVPEDFGFAHDVSVVDSEGVVRNKASFNVDVQVSVTPSRGPVGTPVTIEVTGMGWQPLENSRTVIWDNSYVGWMSSVTTRGTGRAVIPAVGPLGKHRIQIARGAYTFPYLNPAQSPRPDIPVFDRIFTVTGGDPVLPAGLGRQTPEVVRAAAEPAAATEPAIATDVVSGPVGTSFMIVGAGFEPGDTVNLDWYRIVGNRVSGQGWDEESVSLGEIAVGDDGTFEFPSEIPGDVGGPHRVEAGVGGEQIAETTVMITPSAIRPQPSSGPWGTDFEIRARGVGWTETANIYTFVYDNAYLGYVCGFNSQGDVTIPIRATGAPGWHFIDLYPAIYKGEETPGQENFRIPQLTALDDHPGEDLPIFHFAFLITD